jgi:hypothetical protein
MKQLRELYAQTFFTFRTALVVARKTYNINFNWILIEGGAEWTDTFWHTPMFYTTRRNKMKCAIFEYKAGNLLFITFDRWHHVGGVLHATLCLKRFTIMSKTRHNSFWFMVAFSSWIARFIFCVMCGQFLYAHRKKSRAVRSGDRTGHGIPNTWKCSLSLINTLHTPSIHCHWTGFEMAWHHLSRYADSPP